MRRLGGTILAASVIVAAWCGAALAGGPDWQIAGGRAALGFDDPKMVGAGIVALTQADSAVDLPRIVERGEVFAKDAPYVRRALNAAVGRFETDPAKALPFLAAHLPPLDSMSIEFDDDCKPFRAWIERTDPGPTAAGRSLSRPVGVDASAWGTCVGLWSEADVEAAIERITDELALAPIAPIASIAAPLRPFAARRLLERQAAPGLAAGRRNDLVFALRAVGDASDATIDALVALVDDPDRAVGDAALLSLAGALATARSGRVDDRRLVAWSARLRDRYSGARFQVLIELTTVSPGVRAIETAYVRDNLWRDFYRAHRVLDQLRPLPDDIVAMIIAELEHPTSDERGSVAVDLARNLVGHEPRFVAPLVALYRRNPRQISMLLDLIRAGAASQLDDLLAPAIASAAPMAREVLAALRTAKLDAPLAARLRAGILTAVTTEPPDNIFGVVDAYTEQALLTTAALGPLSRAEALSLVEYTRRHSAQLTSESSEPYRTASVIASGGDTLVVVAVRWLSPDAPAPKPASIDDTRTVVDQLLEISNLDAAVPLVAAQAGTLLRTIVNDTMWRRNDLAFLRERATRHGLDAGTRTAFERAAKSVEPAGDSLATWKRIATWAWMIVPFHAVAWLLALAAIYPRSRRVQALMLWSTWGRRMTGLGYTQLLIAWSPPLRRRMFRPLLAPVNATAGASLSAAFYRGVSLRKRTRSDNPGVPTLEGEPQPWEHVVTIDGLVLIDGRSGLGKTWVLRALCAKTRADRAAIFLSASDCGDGVVAAICARLPWNTGDEFTRGLLHNGAIDLYMDGLNEASPDALGAIATFCRTARNTRVVMTAQPGEWPLPRTTQRFRLQPLARDDFAEFLRQQWPELEAAATIERAAYEAAIDRHLATIDDRAAEILSHPIDLAFLAYLLARGASPNVFDLRAEVAATAQALYRESVPGGVWPDEDLARIAVAVLRDNRPQLATEGLDPTVFDALAECKLVLRDRQGAWVFRHDSITCFFAVAGYFGPWCRAAPMKLETIADEHLDAPRFAGIYHQLAQAMPVPVVEVIITAARLRGRDHGRRELEIELQDILDRRRRA